jgi:hypothetical protein
VLPRPIAGVVPTFQIDDVQRLALQQMSNRFLIPKLEQPTITRFNRILPLNFVRVFTTQGIMGILRHDGNIVSHRFAEATARTRSSRDQHTKDVHGRHPAPDVGG